MPDAASVTSDVIASLFPSSATANTTAATSSPPPGIHIHPTSAPVSSSTTVVYHASYLFAVGGVPDQRDDFRVGQVKDIVSTLGSLER
jgi:hypothetical protein